jgi:hypothetical protein
MDLRDEFIRLACVNLQVRSHSPDSGSFQFSQKVKGRPSFGDRKRQLRPSRFAPFVRIRLQEWGSAVSKCLSNGLYVFSLYVSKLFYYLYVIIGGTLWEEIVPAGVADESLLLRTAIARVRINNHGWDSKADRRPSQCLGKTAPEKEQVEVKLEAEGDASDQLLSQLTSGKDAKEKRDIYFYAMPDLALAQRKIFLRARKTTLGDNPDDSTVKIRGDLANKVSQDWLQLGWAVQGIHIRISSAG